MLAVVLLIIHTVIAAGLIWMVLQEMSKFAELGGAFGSGMAYTMFGRKKGLDTSGKITVGLAVAFFVMCFLTSWVLSR
ncbi:protein translocase subunit secG [Fervidobacterium changbaicum]|uniref:Protein-export membrane protein SecG n=2 Tax=Fervidobacterium TaxID=2422 RepID=A0AAI8CN99_FERIS|nr:MULTISPECIES: preprotein translocase subunit SecG [Fervidobacterium]AMW33464.1 preprotein translocase subunit SecG [Fervidobacterium islandicum]QAV33513.1 preprotein translocase subunit SecG [Fervidobacterium changbaicum]SDH62484.1 protein translocase subunit secG [Fervidobacterium changbaicum]